MPNQLVTFLRQSDPSSAAKSDDEITLHYANSYADRFEELSQKYPDWRSDFDRIMSEQAKAQLTPLDYVKNAAGRFVKGAAGTVASIPEAVGVAAQGLDQAMGRPGGVVLSDNFNSSKGLDEYATTKLGGMIRGIGDAVAPETQPILDDSFVATTVPEALGSAAGFAATGATAGAARGAAGKAMQTAAIGLTGAASAGVEQFKDALASGADPDTAMKAFVAGGIVGTSEIVPLNRMLNRLDGVSGGAFSGVVLKLMRSKLSKPIKDGVEIGAEAIRDTFEESLQEAFQSTSGNAIASSILKYDPDRKLTEGLAEDAGAGATTGLVMSLLTQAIGRARKGPAGESAAEAVKNAEAVREFGPKPVNGPAFAPTSQQMEAATQLAAASAPAAASDPTQPPVDPDLVTGQSVGMGLERDQLRELAVKVMRGELTAVEANEALDQDQDRMVFREELGRMMAVRDSMAPSPAQDQAMDPAQQVSAEPSANAVPEVAIAPAVVDEPAPVESPSPVVVDPEPPPVDPAPATAPVITPAPEDPLVAEYAELHAKLDAIAATQRINAADKEAMAEALEEHRLWETFGGQDGVDHSAMVQALAEAKVDLPPSNEVPAATATAPEGGLPQESQPADEAPDAPAVETNPITAAVEPFGGSSEDTAEDSEAPARIDRELSAISARIEDLTKNGGEYQKQMLARRTGDTNETPAGKEVNRLIKRSEKLGALKSRAATGNSRDLLFSPDSLFLEGTGMEVTDRVSTGREAAGYFELAERDGSEDASVARNLYQAWQSAGEAGKQEASDALAAHMASQSIPTGGDRALSRRAAAWQMPDGRVVVALLKNTGGKTGAAPLAGKDASGRPKRGDKFKTSIPKPKSGKAGRPGFYSVHDILSAGGVPLASIRLAVPRKTFHHAYSAAEFNQLSSGAIAAQAAVTSGFTDGASRALSQSASSDGTVLADGGELQARTAPSTTGEARGLDSEERPASYSASSILSQDHAKAIFATYGGGELTTQDAIDVLGDGLQDDDATTQSAFRSLLLAARESLSKNEEFQKLDREGREEAAGSLASKWLQDGSSGDAGESSFVGRLLEASRVAPGAGEGAGGAAQADQAGRGGDSAGGEQGATGASLIDRGFLKDCQFSDAELDALGEKGIRETAKLMRAELGTAEEHGRHRRTDPSAPPMDVDISGMSVRRSRVLPLTASGAVANMNRGQVSPVIVEAEGLRGGLRAALQRIADAQANPMQSKLAAALAGMAPDVEVKIGQLQKSFGYWSGRDITLNPGPHTNVSDLHRTILEEAIHAMTAGWAQAYEYARETLTPAQLRIVEQAKALIEKAKSSGLTWQDMNDPGASFDEFLAATKTNEKFRRQLASVSAGKSLISDILWWVKSVIRTLIGSTGASDRGMLAQADAVADGILRLGRSGGDRSARFRKVDGYAGAGTFESTADDQFDPRPDAGVAIAVANRAQAAYERMLGAYQRASSLGSALNADSFIQFIHETANMGGQDSPGKVITAVVDELARQGLPVPGTETTTLDDLDAGTRRQVAAREAVIGMQRVQGALQQRFHEVSDAFSAEADKLNRLRGELMDTTRLYTSLDYTQKLLLADIRRALRETADRGSGSILKDLGVADPALRKAAIAAAAARIQTNPSGFVDAIDALSASGINFGGLKNGSTKASDVAAYVAASSDPRLAVLKADAASLALAANFAKRHAMLMDLLPARSTPEERRSLDAMISLAISSRPDAFEAAMGELGLLKKLGARGARVLDALRSTKDEFKKQEALIAQFTRIIDAYPEVAPVLASDIRSLQDELAAEVATEGDSSRQWSPAQGAVYWVPENNRTSIDSMFAGGASNPHRRVLELGSKFNANALGEDHRKIKAWLAANPGVGGARRALLERTVSRDTGLLTVSTTNAIHNIRHGLSGVIFSYFGDLGVRMQSLGVHGAREASRMMRDFVAKTEAFGRGRDLAAGEKADELQKVAMNATGIEHPEEFKRRFYSDALSYLETRGDLNTFPAGTSDSDIEAYALDAIEQFFMSREADKALFTTRPGSWPAVREFIRQSGRNNSMVQGWIKKLGLRVSDRDAGFFRSAIGRPLFTMSRMVSHNIRGLVREMSEAWKAPIDWSTITNPGDASTALNGRFTPEVWSGFFLPLAHKTGQALFNAPESGGVVDRASRANVIAAASAANGDFVAFATILHGLEGGAAGDELGFIKSTFETVNRFFRELDKVSEVRDANAEGDEIGRTFLDARQGSNYPSEWLEYRTYGRSDVTRYAKLMAAQSALGSRGAAFKANLTSAETELTKLAKSYSDLIRMPAGPEREAARKALVATGNFEAAKLAAKNLQELKRIRHDFDTLWAEFRGDPVEYRALTRLLGTISGMLVQGVSTTLVDNVTLFEAPARKFGVGKLAQEMTAGNVKGYAGEFFGSLLQAFGHELNLNADWAQDTADLNESGLADPDAFAGGYRSHYRAGVANLPPVMDALRNEGPAAAAVNFAKRATEAASAFISTGKGAAPNSGGYPTFKPLAPFTMGSQFQHRAAARGWLRTARWLLSRAEDHFRSNPADLADPNFRFTYKNLGGAKTFGLVGASNERGFEYLKLMLENAGVSLEDSAREAVAGRPALTELQRHGIIAMAQSEITLNASAITRPTGATGLRGLIANPVVSPLLGWSIAKMADVAKTTRDPNGRASAKAAGSALTAFMVGVLPASLAFAWMRDEYDEEVVGKKPNVQQLTAENAPFALIDRMARVGTFGIAGDVVNSIANFDTARDFSVDSRVLALNTMHSLVKAAGTAIRQGGDVDYQGFYRPLISSLGGSGYLQNFDVINNLTGMDNSEARVVRRINVSNLIRAGAKEAGIEARSSKALASTPSPMKPYVSQMLLSAYANDAQSFREAHRKAVAVVMADKVTRDEASKRVASSYAGQNPVTLTLARKPTDIEWRRMLSGMSREQRVDVESSLRNYIHYGQIIGAPVTSVTAKAPKPSSDWRYLTVNR